MSEIYLQNAIRCALSEYGFVIRQNTGYFKTSDGRTVKCGLTGLPDLLFIGTDGRVAFMEVKTPTGRPSVDQIRFITKLQAYGHRAGIVRSVEDALALIGESGQTQDRD